MIISTESPLRSKYRTLLAPRQPTLKVTTVLTLITIDQIEYPQILFKFNHSMGFILLNIMPKRFVHALACRHSLKTNYIYFNDRKITFSVCSVLWFFPLNLSLSLSWLYIESEDKQDRTPFIDMPMCRVDRALIEHVRVPYSMAGAKKTEKSHSPPIISF